jgi:hypothetical protein
MAILCLLASIAIAREAFARGFAGGRTAAVDATRGKVDVSRRAALRGLALNNR